jgi:WD40 repeat protein
VPKYRETHVVLLDLESGREAVLGIHAGRVRSLRLSRDHRYVVAGNDQGQLKRWEIGEVPIPIEWETGRSEKILGMAITADGTSLVTVDGTQGTLWNLTTRTVIRNWTAHPIRSRSVALSPDGKIVATAGMGNEVKLWKTDDGTDVGTLTGGNTSIQTLNFSPDGKRLVGGTMSAEQPQIPGEVIVWNVETKTAFRPLTGHRLGVWSVVVAPDGNQIASASEDGTIRLWPMPK